jgi:putative protease
MLRKYTDLHFRLQISDTKQLKDISLCEYAYVPVCLIQERIPDKNRIIIVPDVFIGNEESNMLFCLLRLKEQGFTRVLAHTMGHIPIIKKAGMTIHGGMRLNITNSVAAEQYAKLGLADTILSIEMNKRHIKTLKKPFPCGFVAYGKLPMMLLRRFPDINGFIDRKGKFLQLKRTRTTKHRFVSSALQGTYGLGEAELLNPDSLVLSDKIQVYSSLDFAVLMLSSGESAREILNMYKSGTSPDKNFTRGLY